MTNLDLLKYNMNIYKHVESLKCYEQKLLIYDDMQLIKQNIKCDDYFKYDCNKNIVFNFDFWIYLIRIDAFIKNVSNKDNINTTPYIKYFKRYINIGVFKYLYKYYKI